MERLAYEGGKDLILFVICRKRMFLPKVNTAFLRFFFRASKKIAFIFADLMLLTDTFHL